MDFILSSIYVKVSPAVSFPEVSQPVSGMHLPTSWLTRYNNTATDAKSRTAMS
jgi:hypothetical protein